MTTNLATSTNRLIISYFCMSEGWVVLPNFSTVGFTGQTQGVSQLGSNFKALDENHFKTESECWQNIPFGCRTEVLAFLVDLN